MDLKIITCAVLAWISILVISPVLAPILLILWLYRSVIILLSKLVRSDLVEPIKDLELSFCADDFYSSPLGSNAFVWILEGPIRNPEIIRDRLAVLLISNNDDPDKFSRLTTVYPSNWNNVPFWRKASNFSLSEHINLELSRQICGEDELCEFVIEHLRKSFQSGRPCWDVCYLGNYSTGDQEEQPKSVFIFRVHHVTGDGLSMLKVLEAISDESKNLRSENVKIYESSVTPKADGSAGDSSKKKTENVVKNVEDRRLRKSSRMFETVQSIQCLFYAPLIFLHQIKEFGLHSDLLTRRKRSSSQTLIWTTLDFEDMQPARELFKTHNNQFPTIAAYNWILSGALSRYLREDLWRSDEELTGATNLIASLPVKELPRTEGGFANLWTHGIFRFPLDHHSCCPDRRRSIIMENCRRVSALNTPRVFRLLLPLQRLLPYTVIKAVVNRSMGAPVGLTNIAGPRKFVHLGRRKVVQTFAVVGLQWPHASLSCGFFSYDGRLSVTLLGNKELLADCRSKKILNKYFHEELVNNVRNVPRGCPCQYLH